jgi:hypothetical protein
MTDERMTDERRFDTDREREKREIPSPDTENTHFSTSKSTRSYMTDNRNELK